MSSTSAAVLSPPAPPAMGVRLGRNDDLIDLQRRLEAWLLINRFIVAGRTSAAA